MDRGAGARARAPLPLLQCQDNSMAAAAATAEVKNCRNGRWQRSQFVISPHSLTHSLAKEKKEGRKSRKRREGGVWCTELPDSSPTRTAFGSRLSWRKRLATTTTLSLIRWRLHPRRKWRPGMKQTFDNRLNDSVLSGVHFWKWVERGTIKVAFFHALPDSEMYTAE